MPRRPLSRGERWCFPEDLPRILLPDKDERWCFPEDLPRILLPDKDERWCFPEDVPRSRRGQRIGRR
jgi:hypothetical protein